MTPECSFNWAEVRDVSGPCIRPGGPALTERALEVCSLPPGSRVLDLGCGAGGTLAHLERTASYHATGLDYSHVLLREAAPQLKSSRLTQGRAEVLPFKAGAFHALFCECVLSILGDRTAALIECARVLKEGGFLIVSDVFGQSVRGNERLDGATRGIEAKGLLAKEDLLGLLEGLGFSLLIWEEHKRFLTEFAARMVLAGHRLPDLWGCGQGQAGRMAGARVISYFLLVARRQAGPAYPVKGGGAS